ncbi:MAG: hypothetical protein ACFNTM_00125 [Cardiobacterium sp.]
MGYHILNSKGEITGWSETPFETAEGQRLVDEKDYHPDPQAALAAAKTAKLHAAASAAQAFIEAVAGLDGVPQFERDSWAAQALEAQAWATDKSASTPILAGIAQARGVPLDDLRAKALAKSNAYTALTASVAGQRQAYEDQIHAAETLAALDAIAIAYRPPMMPMMPAAQEGK